MRGGRILGLVLTTALLLCGSAAAKMVNGKVSSIDLQTKRLTLQTTDAVTGQASESEMWIHDEAAFRGAASLADLKPGDTVWVEADEDPEGNWEARQVTKA